MKKQNLVTIMMGVLLFTSLFLASCEKSNRNYCHEDGMLSCNDNGTICCDRDIPYHGGSMCYSSRSYCQQSGYTCRLCY
jgi:hypothetical protein